MNNEIEGFIASASQVCHVSELFGFCLVFVFNSRHGEDLFCDFFLNRCFYIAVTDFTLPPKHLISTTFLLQEDITL